MTAAVAGLLAMLLLAGGPLPARHGGEAMTTERPIPTVQVGWTDVPADPHAGAPLMAAVRAWNERIDEPGLPPELNGERLDPERVAAFVSGLVKLPPDLLALIGRHPIRLNFERMRLHSWSPTTAAQLRHGFTLARAGDAANPHLADVRLVAPIDVEASAARLASARAYAQGPDHPARARRSAAGVWLALADALHADAPADARWTTERTAAHRAVDAIDAEPLGGGMP